MRKLLLLLLFTTISLSLFAKPDIQSGMRYRIVCTLFTEGCVTDGATAGQNTPLYYLSRFTTNDENYWILTEEREGYYSIKNAKTGKYVTYDGQRQDSPQLLRYVSMTDAMNGDLSLWLFSQQSDGVYAIRNIQQNDHIWDVRTSSYCVGTYSNQNSANNNQRFVIYDEQGQQVTEKTEKPVTVDGYDVSAWLVATAESPDNWTFVGDGWTDPGFGNYHNGVASIVSPFLERWRSSADGALPNHTLSQTLSNLPQGQYVLTSDIIAVRQAANSWYNSVSEETGYGVWLFANDQQTEAGTANEQPRHYTVNFTVGSNGEAILGIRIKNTNANWVAVDNFALYYQGSKTDLINGEKEKVRAALLDFYSPDDITTMIAACGDDFDALEALRKSVANFPKIDPVARALKNLCIDGTSPAYAESISLYLASTDESNFGTDYTAKITYDKADGWGNLKINGTEVASGSTYRFGNMAAGTNYTLSVSNGTSTVTHKITFTALPVVKIYGTFNNDYSDGYIRVIEPSDEQVAETMQMKAKWRGGITNGNDKHKRNYHVKLKDAEGNKLERKFFGLRNDNSWILESCQVDMSRIRNRVLTDLWNDYSTPPYYIDKEKKAATGTHGQFVELILNDEYRGIYCMTENMDRKQMKLKKYDEAAETVHGQLWKSKDWTYATLMGTRPDGSYYPKDFLSDPNAKSEMWDKFEVKYPDFEDYGNQTDWSTLYNAVDFVCHSTDTEFRQHIAEYFDLPVVIDYYILMETILSTDNHGKNMFFGCYDKQTDKRITFAVWDMDATCGQRWSDQYFHQSFLGPEQDYAQFITRYEHGDYNLFKRLRDTDADDFNMQVRMRYRDLRSNFLATESILSRFSTYLERFKHCGAAQREYDKWNGDTDISRLSLDFDDEMNYLTDWFTRRMNYLDTQRFAIDELPSGIDTATLTDKVQDIYNLSGQKVGTTRQFYSLPAGIYIINGRKVVIK